MVYSESDGCKQLIVCILKQAVLDAKLYRRPEIRSKNIPNNRIVKNKILLRDAFIFAVKNHRFYSNYPTFYSLILLKMMDKIFKYNERDPKSSRIKCIDARRFINADNPSFCTYMNLIGRNPVYVAEKINNEIYLFDRYRKNKLQFFRKSLTE